MYKYILSCTILLSISFFANAQGQSPKDKAWDFAKEAVNMMDDGKVDEAIKLLEEAHRLAPDIYNFEYEIAYGHYLKKDYKKALSVMQRVVQYNGVNDKVYQMLGNLYDMTGDTTNAIKTFKEGLVKFPNSGGLYNDQGNMYYDKKEYAKALQYYEKGISVDPMLASNYFRAAILFLSSEEEVWGMMYGELFILLEPNTDRTIQISKMMYDTYKSEIQKTSDTSYSVSFSKMGNNIDVSKMNDSNFRMPFSTMVYEACMSVGVGTVDKLDLDGFCKIRAVMLDQFYSMGYDKQYWNVLFDYQKKAKDAGFSDVYHHWVLIGGNKDEFGKWYDAHKDQVSKFASWYSNHHINITKSNMFLRNNFEN